jgi:hypothetical protein
MKTKRGDGGKKRDRSQSEAKDLSVKDRAGAVKGGTTPQLAKGCATGSHYPDVKLTV